MLRQVEYMVLGRSAVVRGSVVLCVVILLAVLGTGCRSDSAVSASTTLSRPGRPTATPKPAIKEDAAVLGGAVYAFDKKFGDSNCCYNNGWDYEGPAGSMWTGVHYDGYTAGAIDKTSPGRVKTITISAIQDTPASWSVSQADAICNLYLPPDAKYMDTISVSEAPGLMKGIEKRYTSALLANTLLAGDFTDVNGRAITPGTFYMFYKAPYSNGSPATVVDWCTLSTDENAAQTL